MSFQYTYVQESDGRESLAVFANGELLVASNTHPNFQNILAAAKANDPKVVGMFDAAKAVAAKLERVSDRVVVDNGQVLMDGDVINNTLTEQVVRFLDEGVEDWKPLVAFLENVYSNPSPISRDELCEWVGNHESLTITEDGYIVGYKGCNTHSDGVAYSTVSAPASDKVTVDDVLVTGLVPNKPGSVVAMPRGVVDPDQNRHCSKGLHIGTFAYASGYAGTVLEVHVNPRDIVSVTSDSSRQKIRACRYEVVKVVSEKYTQAVIPASAKRDTRDNHKSQARYPKGHARAGQFIPKALASV